MSSSSNRVYILTFLSYLSPKKFGNEIFLKVFAELFSKSSRPSNARSVGRASQGAKHLVVRKRHERVNFGVAERGETHKWGFPLLCSTLSILYPKLVNFSSIFRIHFQFLAQFLPHGMIMIKNRLFFHEICPNPLKFSSNSLYYI